VLKGGTNLIELHHVKGLEHSDGMLVAYLPGQRILFSAESGSAVERADLQALTRGAK
jgi:hypothetical protein